VSEEELRELDKLDKMVEEFNKRFNRALRLVE